MTIKNIETAYKEIYDFLDEIDSHPLSAQISLPIPDLVDGVWVDKYFVYEDISIGGKHIAYSPDWIFVFRNGKMIDQHHLEDNGVTVEYKLSPNTSDSQSGCLEYLEVYGRIKSLHLDSNKDNIIGQYLNIFKRIIPQELVSYYVATSTQLAKWVEQFG